LGKSRSRNKVFAEEKKERKDKQLQNKIAQLEKENAKLRREIEAYKAAGKVPVVKEKPKPKPPEPPKLQTLEEKRKAAREAALKWRKENLGDYSEE
jgi:hypothetical protein